MTRLDASSEPSMEDILASIRKIIAEDPPGTRAIPAASGPANQSGFENHSGLGQQMSQPQQAPTASALRTLGRDGFFPASLRGDAIPAPASDAYSRPEQEKPFSSALEADAFFARPAPKSFIPEASASAIEPSFAAVSEPSNVLSAMSVDAQLSDLLGDALPDAPVPDTSTTSAYNAAQPAWPTGDAAVQESPSHLEPRAGFTVSRDGYLPSAAAAEPVVERDPFDFDLGPSPFESKPSPAMTNPAGSFDLGGVIPSRGSEGDPQTTIANSSSFAPESTAAAQSEFPIQDGYAKPIAAPSVAATIAPDLIAPDLIAPDLIVPEVEAASVRAPEPVARFIPANAGMESPRTVERDVMEVGPYANSTMTAAHSGDLDDAEPGSASVPMTQVHDHQRTMEDTVADLLRPMLKTWLAENMPRIVERALRREINEQLHADTQAAAE